MRRRPQSLIMILIAAVLVGLFYGGFTVGALVANAKNVNDFKRELPFDRLSNFGLQFGAFFGSIILVVMASGLIGNEFSWNTIRPLLARSRSRATLLTAKFLTLLIYVVIFCFVLAVLTGVFSLIGSKIAGVDTAFSTNALVEAFWYTWRIVLVNLPTVALAFMLALVARSNAAGIGVALGVTFLEPILFAILGNLSDIFVKIEKGGLSYNTNKILMDGIHNSGQWVALAVMLAYTAIFVAISYVVFLRRDVTSG